MEKFNMKRSKKIFFWYLPVEIVQFWKHIQIPKPSVSVNDLPVELCSGPDCKVASWVLHHVEHPLDLVVITMILLQLQFPIFIVFQTEVSMSLHDLLKTLVPAAVRTFHLNNSSCSVSTITTVLFSYSIRFTDKPLVLPWNIFFCWKYFQWSPFFKFSGSVRFMFVPISHSPCLTTFD